MSEQDEAEKKTQENNSVQESITSSLKKDTVEVPKDKVFDLIRTQVLRDLQAELLIWGKQRFWVVAVVVLVLAILGGPLLIREVVRSLVEREVEKVERRMEEASKVIGDARLAAAGFIKEADTHVKTVTSLQDRARQIDAQFIALRQRLEAESRSLKATATREVKDVSDRIVRLEKLVGQVAKDSQTSQQLVDAYQKEIAELKANALSQAKRFAENSRYQVTVYYNDKTSTLSTSIVDRLSQAGFKAASSDISFLSTATSPFPFDFKVKPVEIPFDFQVKPFQKPTGNTISYDVGGDTKVKEIAELLRPVVHFKQIRPFTLGEPRLFTLTFFSLPRDIYISIYLVEKA